MPHQVDRRQHPSLYTPAELHRFLVADAVARVATPLNWAVEAYKRIGEKSGKGPEVAYTAVVDEVETLTGSRAMPMGARVSDRELHLLQRPTDKRRR